MLKPVVFTWAILLHPLCSGSDLQVIRSHLVPEKWPSRDRAMVLSFAALKCPAYSIICRDNDEGSVNLLGGYFFFRILLWVFQLLDRHLRPYAYM